VILEFDPHIKPEHYDPYAFEEWAPGNGFGYLLLEVIKYSSEGDIIAHNIFLGDFYLL